MVKENYGIRIVHQWKRVSRGGESTTPKSDSFGDEDRCQTPRSSHEPRNKRMRAPAGCSDSYAWEPRAQVAAGSSRLGRADVALRRSTAFGLPVSPEPLLRTALRGRAGPPDSSTVLGVLPALEARPCPQDIVAQIARDLCDLFRHSRIPAEFLCQGCG